MTEATFAHHNCKSMASVQAKDGAVCSLDDKVAFLSNKNAYCPPAHDLARRETHMSWIFFADDTVYKLKKPVKFPYLDFSTLSRREAACRAELALNRRLAPDVYVEVMPLVQIGHRLAIDKPGTVLDWLVVMRRLNEAETLENALLNGDVRSGQLDRLVATLATFYRHAGHVFVSPDAYLRNLRQSLAYNRSALLHPDFRLPAGRIARIDRAQRRFLSERADMLKERVRDRCIVDGHGDLRPEHIWLGDPVRIIDCLEFNAKLRAVDPFDEIAFLCVECERLGDPRTSEQIRRRALNALRDGIPDELFTFFRCHRATLRARLAIAHLFEPSPREPKKWRTNAISYLRIAAADAARLERALDGKSKTPASLQVAVRSGGAEPLQPREALWR